MPGWRDLDIHHRCKSAGSRGCVVANDDIQQKLMGITAETYALAFVSLLSKKPLTSSAKLHASEDLPDLPYATNGT